MDLTESSYESLTELLSYGGLTLFLGAGVNAPESADEKYTPGQRLPRAAELAEQLADEFEYPFADRSNLVRVSQWAVMTRDQFRLYLSLHKIFDRDYALTPILRLLGRLPAFVRSAAEGDEEVLYPLYITTNYDDVLERSLIAQGETFDLLVYRSPRGESAYFDHIPPGGRPTRIVSANTYQAVDLIARPVVMKIHGAVRRGVRQPSDDSYVVTEDDYLRAMTATDLSNMLPPDVVTRMHESSFLFLGYSLKDWNLRTILHRIQREQRLDTRSLAVGLSSDVYEDSVWRSRNVDRCVMDLGDFARSWSVQMGIDLGEETAVAEAGQVGGGATGAAPSEVAS